MSNPTAVKQDNASANIDPGDSNAEPEVQFYPPSQALKSKVKALPPGAGFSAIERAEQAMGKLSVRFEGWITEEVEALQSARDGVDKHGYNGEFAEELFRSAHDLKGQGLTFGYPLVTYVAGSLCNLLETMAVTETKSAPIALIDHHVDAIRAIVRDGIKGNTHSTASELATSLAEATEVFVQALKAKRKDA